MTTLSDLIGGGFVGFTGSQGPVGPIDTLTDVVIGTPNALDTGNILLYDGSEWVNSSDLTILTTTLNTVFDPLVRQTDNTQITAISVGTTAPTFPATGDLWVDTN